MHILRYRSPSGAVAVGVLREDVVSQVRGVSTLAELWRLERSELEELLARSTAADHHLGELRLLPPVDGRTEVWACGVTYETSREARAEESGTDADAYRRVYDAPRPELFFKSAAWRVVGDGQVVAVRTDSSWDVPEPELALVVASSGEVVGLTVCDDVSSRSIEGENPLYLPQAKTYLGACAVGPMIRPAWEVTDLYDLDIELVIARDGERVWQGAASTGRLHRRMEELVEHLVRADAHPDGAVLSTGTCLVPEPPFTLTAGDVVQISISDVGTLTTGVVAGPAAMSWLVDGTTPPTPPHLPEAP